MNARAKFRSTKRITPLVLLVAGLVLAVSAGAAVTIYTNKFEKKREFKSLRKAQGGKECDRSWWKKRGFGVGIKQNKRSLCAYRIPVFADGSGGDYTIQATGKIPSEDTVSKIRKGASLVVAVRASKPSRYEFRLYPRGRRYELRRFPRSDEFPVKGKSKKIEGLDKRNRIKFRIIDDTINVWINGTAVISKKVDSAAADVSGSASWVGVGQDTKAQKPTLGTFAKVRFDVTDP